MVLGKVEVPLANRNMADDEDSEPLLANDTHEFDNEALNDSNSHPQGHARPPLVTTGESTVSSLTGSENMDDEIARMRNESIGVTMRSILSIIILTLINLLNYMDRSSVAGVLVDIKIYYDINEKQSGLIQTAFIISYMLLSPVFGYLGDRYRRKYIMAGGILCWSFFTLMSSFIPKHMFYLFLLMRCLVGVGEASYSTIAPTIIADLFVNKARSIALTVFYFAIPVGSGLGYIVGSTIGESFKQPGVDDSWKWALRFTPALGVICTVLIMLLVKEPERGAADASQNLHATSYKKDLVYLTHNMSFILSSAGFTCVAFVAGALAWWAPTYMSRSIVVDDPSSNPSNVAMIFGGITVFAGIVGVALGTISANWLKKYTPRADPFVCAFGMLGCTPFLFFSLYLSRIQTIVSWVCILFGEILLCLNWAVTTDILMYVVIPTRRSTAAAVQILMSHLFGDAGSPFLIGVISDAVVGNQIVDPVLEYTSLQYALYTTSFACVVGGAFYLFTTLFVVRDRRNAEAIIHGSRGVDDSPPSTPDLANGTDAVDDPNGHGRSLVA